MIHTLNINRFDEGISDDPREPISERNAASLIQHFDCFSNPFKLTPYRATEADHATNVSSTAAKAFDIRHFKYSSAGLLWGLGENGSGQPKVLRKADPTTGNWLASDGSAAATAIGEGNAAQILGCFFEWASRFWLFQGTNQVAAVLISSGVITNSITTVGETIITVADGVVAPDGNAYAAYNNKVIRISSAAAVTDNVAPTIPADMRITSLEVVGSYLVIGCAYGTSATQSPIGLSKVFIWDLVVTTFIDVVDWGEGALMVLGNVEGNLIGISDKYLSSALGLSRGSMVIRIWTGGSQSAVLKEIVANQAVTLGRFLRDRVIKNNKLYWVASVPFGASTSTESTFHLGIWAFGRKNINGQFTLSLDYVVEGIDASNFLISSFGAAGDYWFVNHSNDGSIAKTDDTATYTNTSIYDTQIWKPAGARKRKKLLGITVDTEALASGEQVVLKYKKDEETSFTTILTHDTDNALYKSAINIESSGVNLPEFREIILRAESTGGAKITNIFALAEDLDSDLYS